MPANAPVDPLAVNASPTKRFFISMLAKDVQLIPAIIDLVDNSLDGARRTTTDKDQYNGLWIRLTVRKDRFEIADNCGGIDVKTARDYAFRFGRPGGFKPTTYSVGQFGVGMKRALFKIGERFKVVSATESSRFSLTVDVAEWEEAPDWEFKFDQAPQVKAKVAAKDIGTVVTVTKLHPPVAEEFSSTRFVDSLRYEIGLRHTINVLNGLAISVNALRIRATPPTLLESAQIKPVTLTVDVVTESGANVAISIYAGVSESNPNEAGWYVYCNDRLVLGPDQTEVTGWGSAGNVRIPDYHNQFASFRGYVFLDADDSSALPWNTTKTSVDVGHAVFRRARLEMTQAMRPVIDFLNRLKEEKEADSEPALQRTLDGAKATPLEELPEDVRMFTYPTVPRYARGTGPDEENIQYRKPTAEIRRIKKALGVGSNRLVGEKTFEYFLKYGLED